MGVRWWTTCVPTGSVPYYCNILRVLVRIIHIHVITLSTRVHSSRFSVCPRDPLKPAPCKSNAEPKYTSKTISYARDNQLQCALLLLLLLPCVWRWYTQTRDTRISRCQNRWNRNFITIWPDDSSPSTSVRRRAFDWLQIWTAYTYPPKKKTLNSRTSVWPVTT